MKKLAFLVMAFALLTVGMVSATETTLVEDSIAMDYEDVQEVEFCIKDQQDNPMDVDVVVEPIWQELTGDSSFSVGDIENPTGFSVVPNEPTTGADGCVMLTLTTDLSEEEAGIFYYVVNGYESGAISAAGSETGTVYVPEFGVIAGALALVGIGLFIYRKRN